MKVLERALEEPVALSAAVIAMFNVAAALGALHLTNTQLGELNVALGAVLAFLARMHVTPSRRLRAHRERHQVPALDASKSQ